MDPPCPASSSPGLRWSRRRILQEPHKNSERRSEAERVRVWVGDIPSTTSPRDSASLKPQTSRFLPHCLPISMAFSSLPPERSSHRSRGLPGPGGVFSPEKGAVRDPWRTCQEQLKAKLTALGWRFKPLLLSRSPWEFLGGPVVRSLRFHCRGPGFNPWSGN